MVLSSVVAFFFFLKHINDVMISHFAADNGRQMCVNALSKSKRSGGLLKDIDFERSQTCFLFSPLPPSLPPLLHTLIVKFKSGDDKQSDYTYH